MTIAVPTRPLARPSAGRPRPGLRRGLMAGASLVLHVVVLGSMILLAADEDHPVARPLPPIIQLEIERAPLPPQWRRPQPQPVRPVEPQTEPLPQPQTQPLVPTEAEAPRPLSVPLPAPTPAPTQIPVPTPPKPLPAVQAAPIPVPVPIPAPVIAPKPALAPPVAATQRAPSLAAPALPDRRPAKDKDEDEAVTGAPSAPAPRLALPAPGGAPAPAAGGITDTWRFAPEGQSGRNARALRVSPSGCPSTGMLTQSERDVCNERFNARAAEGAERPITGSGNAQRDARFAREGAREMQRYEAQRRPLSGGVGVIPPQECPGSNFGTGCAGAHLDPSMRQGATTNVKQDSNKPN